MRIEVWTGDAARARLRSSEFREEWERLFAHCPWASVFQSYGHAAAWYNVYAGHFGPLLVGARDAGGSLCGLFPLALTPEGDPIAAGGRQAEYQVWISRPNESDAFIDAALERLSVECPGKQLALRYLPPDTPREWLMSRSGAGRRCVISPVRRGIMDIDQAEIDATLQKKAYRRHLRGLVRFGPLTYDAVTDPWAIDALLEEMMPLSDLRHGALHDVLPFRSDPLKLAYHRALAHVPGVLHVSALRSGRVLASAQIDVINRGQITLALGAFAPSLARHSPGRLHLLLMARHAAANGYRSIDLTPGGGYKDELATRFDDAYTLHVFPDARRRAMWRAAGTVRRATKSLMARTGVDLRTARDQAASLREAIDSEVEGSVAARTIRALKSRMWADREVELYELDNAAVAAGSHESMVQVDSLLDLVTYRPGVGGREPRAVFLRRALARLERGSRVYTRVVACDLVASVWLSTSLDPSRDADISAVAEPGTAIVHDFGAGAAGGGRGIWNELLAQVARDARHVRDVTRVLIAVPRDRADVREAVRQLGAKPVGSLYTRIRGRRTQQWSTVALAPARSTPDRRPAGAIG